VTAAIQAARKDGPVEVPDFGAAYVDAAYVDSENESSPRTERDFAK
jgi:hypothetical protein